MRRLDTNSLEVRRAYADTERQDAPVEFDVAFSSPDPEAATEHSPGHVPRARTKEDPDWIAKFRVLRRLGAGAMGVVYLAVDEDLDRNVAIKLLRADSQADRDRLRREARALARLNHPNVVTIHEVGVFGSELYVAMEYVEGVTLREWLDSERRPWDEVIEVFDQASAGLEAAHAAGLVHRDFKPANVLVGSDGRVRVADFGLAKVAGEGSEVPRGTVVTTALVDKLTRSGALVGTPAYMSPEQFSAAKVDARSDQFSFAVALYEALYRRNPFKGNTIYERAEAVTAGDVQRPPGGKRTRVPRRIGRALMQALSADPDERFASLEEFSELLRTRPSPRRVPSASGFGAGTLVVQQDAKRPTIRQDVVLSTGSFNATPRPQQFGRGVLESLRHRVPLILWIASGVALILTIALLYYRFTTS